MRARLNFSFYLAQIELIALTASVVIFSLSGCGPAINPVGKAGQEKRTTNASASVNSSVEDHRPRGKNYVGSEACRQCHTEAFESFHHHPMSRSLEEPRLASQIEDFENTEFSTGNGVSYYVEKTPEGLIHHEKRVDAAGDLIYDQGVPVAFSVGSGRRGRSYLVNQSGRLSASPISWFTWDQKWDLSPGYVPDAHARFDRRVSDGCVSCHAGRTETHGQDLNRFAEHPFPERSIGCERCHGPGGEHVAYRMASLSADAALDPVFNPARVNDARRDAVCNQCHLQGRRRVVLSGRTEFDFQAGMTLSENWIVFLKTASIQTGEAAAAVSQVEQMYSSRCYQAAGQQLGCITCHSGHELPVETAATSFYREKCLSCHASGKTECSEPLEKRKVVNADDSCIVCHMPRFPASDVHATQTDHRVLRRPKNPDTGPKKRERLRDAKPVIFEEPGVRLSKSERDRARGIFIGEQASAGGTTEQGRQAIELLIAAIKEFPRDVESRFILGKALEAAGQPELANRAWQQVLELQPTHEEGLEALAILSHQNGDIKGARDYYSRLIEVNPPRPNYYGRLAHVLGQLDEIPRGIEIAEKCLTLNPSLVQTHAWLVEAYRRVGNEAEAARHEAILKRFQSTKNRTEPDVPKSE